MPVVPVEQTRVDLAQGTGVRERAGDYSGTDGAARGLQGLGQAVSGAGVDAAEVEQRFTAASTKDAMNQVSQTYADMGYSGPDAFFNTKGREALDARDKFQGAIKARVDGLRSSLSPRALKLFNRAYADQNAEWTRQIGSHVDKEVSTYDTEQSSARAGIALNAASNAVISRSPTALEESDKQLDTARGEYEQFGHLSGWAPEKTKLYSDLKVSSARHDIAVTLNNSGPEGPQVAQAYIDRYKNDFTADDMASAQTHVRTTINAQQAEQRRMEADARREAQQAKHDAGDRAADVERQIGAGVPLPPDVVAGAITDARKAERPALEFGIKQGAFKNNLTLQYRNATPSELQDRINTLGSDIAHAGSNVTVEQKTEYDHLQTLLGKTQSELREDPISWGASHLGLNVDPIKWNDPGSVQQRVKAAQVVASRTGAPVRILTAPEATALSSQISSGDAGQQRSVVRQLAGLGQFAPVAAAQIAPGNDAFVNMVNLADATDRAAGAQHVDWILAGRDILKANPKLLKPEEAGQMFAGHVGNALELLPSVMRGAAQNAAPMAAAVAQHIHGGTDWASSGREAYGKVMNDVFGATRDPQGVIRGGIDTINGRRTLLPDGWSRNDVETVIAKAPLSKWQGAWNRQPADAKGGTLRLDQLRQMQFVAIGDGRYRLTDGAHYLGKKGGGFFEIDVRKMR